MIRSFRHTGLRLLYRSGSRHGLPPTRAERLEAILALLDVAERPDDLALPAFSVYQLQGKLVTSWSVSTAGGWSVMAVSFQDDLFEVDLVDYH